MEHLQRLACLCITGALRTMPTMAMELITALIPLPIFTKQTAMSHYRLKANYQWVQNHCGHTIQ